MPACVRVGRFPVSGRHAGPPLGDGAREATASPYIGKRRALEYDECECGHRWGWHGYGGCYSAIGAEPYAMACACQIEPPDDPPRCGSCGHHLAGECGCSCCEGASDG